jgi:hypothetical protein
MIAQIFNVSKAGKPVVGAIVTATPDDPVGDEIETKAATDAHGNVTMNLHPGSYNIRVYHAGNQEATALIVGSHANPFPILMK